MPRQPRSGRAAGPRSYAVPRSRFIAAALGISFALSLAVILVLMAFDVRLGQGYFAYRFSPVRELRTPRALAAIPVVVLACGAVYLLSSPLRTRRRMGLAAFVLSLMLGGAWCCWAPPSPLIQHMFNFTSPSSDGAFYVEAASTRWKSIPAYLRDFPERVDQQTPETMLGTRVLSNPPGTTAFLRLILPRGPEDRGWLESLVSEDGRIDRPDAALFADTLRVAIALCIVWSLAGLAGYGLGRVFLSPAGAATFAILTTFNPAVIEFVPGKDPAQLLTINLMLWTWFAGVKQNRLALCVCSGALLVLGSTVGLIHIWVALAVGFATLWEDRSTILKPALAVAIGALALMLLAWAALNWDIPLTLWAVARKWSAIQKTFQMSRPLWYLIGLPIFLLFLSPGFWALLARSASRWRLNLGTRLFLSTLLMMLFTYFVIGMTYELPRLWAAFLPPLMLGLAIDFPILRGRGFHPHVARVLMILVLTQMIYTTFHWTLFDVRETEYRLISKRFYH